MTVTRKMYLYNTAKRAKELFVPEHETVGMYCCGPTVYNYAHIGNLRTYLFEDVLKRTLVAFGYPVKHVVNITDVGHLTSDEDSGEDKMEKGARREGKTVGEIAEHFTQTFMADIASLNIKSPDIWPKATDHITQMIDLVSTLEDKGFTYKTSDGIYFDTSKFPDYIAFARLDPENLRGGERVDMGEKRNVTDFALWKFSPENEKRQMEWESPWGTGFPGWHIECSAMSLAYLPQPLDIHCGGADHIRVHHTNEIAQTEAATGKPFARFWVHGEFLVLDKGKMAKSGGSFITLSSLKEREIPPLAYRLFCFSAHYRSPLTFSWDGLKAAAQSLSNIRKAVAGLEDTGNMQNSTAAVDRILKPFYTAVGDDLNMPRAMAAVWDIIKDSTIEPALRRACCERADVILGLDLTLCRETCTQTLEAADGTVIHFECEDGPVPQPVAEKLATMVALRRTARKNKDYATADALRQKLTNLGVVLADQSDGTTVVGVPPKICKQDAETLS